MSVILKKIAVPLLSLSFLAVAFFGFSFMSMSHGSDGHLQSGCLFSSAAGTSLCPQDAFAATVYHVSAYQSFFGISVESAITILMSTLLLLVAYVLISLIRQFVLRPPIRGRYPYRSPPLSARTREITRWLALLEHSPSLL